MMTDEEADERGIVHPGSHAPNRLDWRADVVVGHALRDRIAMMIGELNVSSGFVGGLSWVPAHWTERLWEIDRVIRDLGIEGESFS